MADLANLHDQLLAMPRDQYAELIKTVDSARRQRVEEHDLAETPSSGISRDDFAAWIARRHHTIDKGIIRVIDFPQGAPTDEVRLIEVNDLANIPENAPVTAVDFMPDIDGIPYTLLVADVTPLQWEAIRNGTLPLPDGWSLEGCRILIDDHA